MKPHMHTAFIHSALSLIAHTYGVLAITFCTKKHNTGRNEGLMHYKFIKLVNSKRYQLIARDIGNFYSISLLISVLI